MRLENLHKLLLIVLAGVAVRVFTLWVGRPEFTGWLNHTYYYFVQVRGLLEERRLPYPDMPLLFWIDSGIARALVALGMEPDAAVIAATRLVMCVVPALIAVPVYGIVRALNRGRAPRPPQWVLIALSAFLPLSVLYLPEFLQKNMLGLLLLATLVFYSQRLLRRFDWRDAGISATLMVSITLSHFGTFAAAVLWGLSLALASALVHRSLARFLLVSLLLTVSGGIGMTLIGLFDPQRLQRLFDYARDSVHHSLVGALFVSGSDTLRILTSLAALLVFYSLLFAAYRLHERHRESQVEDDRTFLLANILFCGLLVMPLLDERLTGRLVLFASVPLVVVLVYLEDGALRRRRLEWVSIVLLTVATVLLTVGELVSSRVHNAHHESILRDLREIGARQWLEADDLVITRTGAEHVCNWFYRIRAGVITSLSLEDFDRYDDVWVLNPLDGTPSGVDDAPTMRPRFADGSELLRRNIPRPPGVEPVFVSENVELFRLDQPPPDWAFSESGRWTGYSDHDD